MKEEILNCYIYDCKYSIISRILQYDCSVKKNTSNFAAVNI